MFLHCLASSHSQRRWPTVELRPNMAPRHPSWNLSGANLTVQDVVVVKPVIVVVQLIWQISIVSIKFYRFNKISRTKNDSIVGTAGARNRFNIIGLMISIRAIRIPA
ncbi:hypothetical protein A2U01_0058733, partial [Trifolium medium]|nr:hypothetical protein [Trifolium medium]